MATESLIAAIMIEITETITNGMDARPELGTVIGRNVAGEKSPGNGPVSARGGHIGDGVTNTGIIKHISHRQANFFGSDPSLTGDRGLLSLAADSAYVFCVDLPENLRPDFGE